MARAVVERDEDSLPEADRLDAFPHPRETRQLFGQADAEQALEHAFSEGRMHHAWLLCGKQGIGKATLAYRLARHVLARPEERQPGVLDVSAATPASRQVAALSHPGLLLLRRPYDARSRRFSTGIPVDEVRRLKTFLGLTAGDRAWRVVIVDSADELNPNAANALLKSLEEPPARALFLLVSAEPGGLLPTIRSRCRRLDLSPLGATDLRLAVDAAFTAAGAATPKEREWDQLERIAEGSVRRALVLASEGGLESHESIARVIAGLPRIDWTAAHALADSLASSPNEQRFEAFFELFLDAVAKLARDQARERGVEAPGGAQGWAVLWATLLREKAEIDLLNLDRRAFILSLFNRLQQAVDE